LKAAYDACEADVEITLPPAGKLIAGLPDVLSNILNWSLSPPSALLALALGYALGSIPFGLLLTRLAGTQDIRSIGSGNIGATNVLRTGRKGLAAATLLADMLKGTAAVLVARWLLGAEAAILAGFGAFLGHLFPVWLSFKGGKGVATYIGALAGLAWPAALVYGGIWLPVAYFTRYSSLAGLVASLAMPPTLWLLGESKAAAIYVLMTVLVFIKHDGNIRRLLAGTEGKIGQTAENPPQSA
jgi:glycerol-3-phosphate acyltransferase PlsY